MADMTKSTSESMAASTRALAPQASSGHDCRGKPDIRQPAD